MDGGHDSTHTTSDRPETPDRPDRPDRQPHGACTLVSRVSTRQMEITRCAGQAIQSPIWRGLDSQHGRKKRNHLGDGS